MSFGPRLKWIKGNLGKINYTQLLIFIIAIIIGVLIVKKSEIKYLFSTVLISAAIFLLFISISDFFKKQIQFPQKVSHFAFSVLILSILINGVISKEFNSNMKVGDEKIFMDKVIKFKSINLEKEKNYQLLRGNFEIIDSSNQIINFSPEIRIYDQPVVSTSEADIRTNLFHDNFMVFSLINNEEIFNVRYQYKPLMMWIWISLIVLALGGAIAVFKR